jgi:hypothetical protein
LYLKNYKIGALEDYINKVEKQPLLGNRERVKRRKYGRNKKNL